MVGRDERDSTSLGHPEDDRAADRRAPRRRRASACPEELTRRGHRARRARRASRRRSKLARGARRDDRARAAAARAARAERLLRARAGRGVVEPRALRRRALRPARRRPTTCVAMYTRTRHDGFGAEVKRRIMLGTYALSSGYYDAYYGRAQRVRTKIADDFRAAFERFDFVVTPTAPTVAFELGAKTADPLAMYLNDYCTVPDVARRHPGDLDPVRAERGPAGRLPARRPGVQREPHPRRGATRSSRRSASTARRRAHGATLTSTTSPSSAWRSTSSSRRARRCSAAASCPSASRRTRAPARSASACPGTLPVANARGDPLRADDRPGARLRARAAVDLPPQELLLSRPAQGLPDQPVRRAPVPRRAARRRAHPPRAPRGGRGEARPRGLERAHPRLATQSVVDFNRGGTPLAEIVTEPDVRSRRAGARVAAAAAHDAAPARRQRREHGGGLAALRRQRLDPPRRRSASSARRPS